MATDMFLNLDKIDDDTHKILGESEDFKHPNEIEISGWSTSFEQPAAQAKTATGPSVERCKPEPIAVNKIMDKATPMLLKRIWSGQIIPEGLITCYRADEQGKPVLYLTITMKHILVTTYSLSGAEGDLPQEEVGLSCGYMQFDYNQQKKIGGAEGVSPASVNWISGEIS